MWLADLHVHSSFSDGKMTIPEIVDFYGQRREFGCVAVTDHLCEEEGILGHAAHYLNRTLNRKSFPLYLKVLESEARRAMKQYNLLVIPGFELTKNSFLHRKSAHLLGLGVSRYLSADEDVATLARKIRKQGAVAIAAHPVSTRTLEAQTYYLWNNRDRLQHEFDAWEVASGPHFFSEVFQSGLPMVASSDLHHPKQINAWKTVFEGKRTEKEVLKAIRNQNLGFEFYQEEDSDGQKNVFNRSQELCWPC